MESSEPSGRRARKAGYLAASRGVVMTAVTMNRSNQNGGRAQGRGAGQTNPCCSGRSDMMSRAPGATRAGPGCCPGPLSSLRPWPPHVLALTVPWGVMGSSGSPARTRTEAGRHRVGSPHPRQMPPIESRRFSSWPQNPQHSASSGHDRGAEASPMPEAHSPC